MSCSSAACPKSSRCSPPQWCRPAPLCRAESAAGRSPPAHRVARVFVDREVDIGRDGEPHEKRAGKEEGLCQREEGLPPGVFQDVEEEVPADGLLDLDERTVGRQGLAVLHPHGRGGLGDIQTEAGGDARGLVDRLVVGVDGLLLVLRQRRPVLGRPWRGGVDLVDQQHVLHRFLLLLGWSAIRRTGSAESTAPGKKPTKISITRFGAGYAGRACGSAGEPVVQRKIRREHREIAGVTDGGGGVHHRREPPTPGRRPRSRAGLRPRRSRRAKGSVAPAR